MADTRINALSTATVSISDDFLPIDGTTAGTKKLSAYNPSFGGNATVGGTLAVSSTATSSSTTTGALVVSGGLGVGGAVTSGGGYYFGASADAALTRVSAGVIALGGAATSRIDINGATDVGIGFRQTGVRDWFINAKSAELQTSCLSAGSIASYESGVLVRVRDTTASTSTSTGALVVGNGTSGGLGVGGAANVGGVVKGAQNTHSDASVPTGLSAGFQVDVQAATTRDILTFGDSSRHGLIRGYQDGAGTINWRFGRYTASTFAEYVRIAGLAAADAVVSIFGTTASDGTSNGALIISGGAGISGAVNVGTFYGMVDGVTAPATTSGYAKIYVDSADGDLKVKFGDGTVKTIATDS